MISDKDVVQVARLLNDHDLTEMDIVKCLCLRIEHSSAIWKIEKFLKDGYDLEQIELAYMIRDNLGCDDVLSLDKIVELFQFADVVDPHQTVFLIEEAKKIYKCKHANLALKTILIHQEHHQYIYLEDLLDINYESEGGEDD